MTCEHVESLLVRAVDHTLDQSRRQSIDQHLATCAACREALQAQEAIRRTLAERPETPVPLGFTARVRSSLELTASGARPAEHRNGRGAPLARRDERASEAASTAEQRPEAGCGDRRMQRNLHHGRLDHSRRSEWINVLNWRIWTFRLAPVAAVSLAMAVFGIGRSDEVERRGDADFSDLVTAWVAPERAIDNEATLDAGTLLWEANPSEDVLFDALLRSANGTAF